MPVNVEIPVEKWAGSIRQITLGATAAEGGTRSSCRHGRRRDHAAVPGLRGQDAAIGPRSPSRCAPSVPPRSGPSRSPKPGAMSLSDVAAWAKAAEGSRRRRDRLAVDDDRQRRPEDDRRESPPGGARRARRHRSAGDRLRRRPGGARQRDAGRVRRRGRGRAFGAGPVRGQELPHHRRRGAGARPPGHGQDPDGCQPVQAVERPGARHGHADGADHHRPDHRLAGLRHRVRLQRHGAPAAGRAPGRRHDAAAHDRHPRRGGVARQGSPRRRRRPRDLGRLG